MNIFTTFKNNLRLIKVRIYKEKYIQDVLNGVEKTDPTDITKTPDGKKIYNDYINQIIGYIY